MFSYSDMIHIKEFILIIFFICCIWWCVINLYYFDVLLDIDECSTGVHNCTQNQQCVNRPGDYECECVSGYELVNEICEGNN